MVFTGAIPYGYRAPAAGNRLIAYRKLPAPWWASEVTATLAPLGAGAADKGMRVTVWHHPS
jgi:hypothetical protein